MDSIAIDVKVSKKEKKHRKKQTTVDENDCEGMQTVSSTCCQQQEKMLTVEERKKDSNKHSVTKIISTDDTHDNCNSTQLDVPCVPVSDLPVRWKGEKKLKAQSDHSKNDVVIQNTETASDFRQKLRKKRKKFKHSALSNNTAVVNAVTAANHCRKVDTDEAVKESGEVSSLIEVKGDENGKRRRKKAAVDESYNENIQADLPGDKKEKQHKKKTTANKNDDKNTLPNFPIKRKSGKKRKMLQDVECKNEGDATLQNTDIEPEQKLRKKQKKVKQAASGDNTTSIDTDRANTAQYRALEYLRMWKCAVGRWTFQKVRQVWLLQHMYDANKVTSPDSSSLFKCYL